MRKTSKGVLILAGLIICGNCSAYAQTINTFDIAVVTGTLIVIGTTTVKNVLEMSNSSITLTGPNGYIVASSTIHASTFSAVPGSGTGVLIRANDNSGTGVGGTISLLAGVAGAGNIGGSINLTAGNGSNGPGGTINVTAGTGGNVGGDINLRAGDETVNGSHIAGDINITAGNGAGAGNFPGTISLNPGNDGAGNYSNVQVIKDAAFVMTGTGGRILIESSVTASGFFGASASLTQLDANGAAQFGTALARSTFSATPGGAAYALDLSSGVHLAAGGVYLNTGGFVRWADGTTSTTSGGGANSVVGFATAAVPNDQSTTNSTYGVGFATVNYTVQNTNSLLKFCFHGTSRNSAANDAWGINWIMDGAFVSPRAANLQPYMGFNNSTANRDFNSNFCDIIAPGTISAAAHRFTLVMKSLTGGTTTKICDSANLPQDCSILVEELK
jgi:hypothetical protein